MPVGPLPVHEWVSFTDEQGDDWLFDLTFLTSSWQCIFGHGCPGVLDEPLVDLEQGCCSHGAYLTGDADQARVTAAANRLPGREWQFRAEAERRGGPFMAAGDGLVTRTVDGACIFLNRPGFGSGAGCALHQAAEAHGERPMDWKPDVCWQLPLRLVESADEHGRTTHTLRAWTRRDWGEGGEDFHWWCTESADAFVGDQPVYIELRDELVGLVGADLYNQLCTYLERDRSSVPLPHPALKKRG